MFAREGYVPLSRLWPQFRTRFLDACKRHAFDYFESAPEPLRLGFGTALDLCEDVFLRSMDHQPLELVPASGDVLSVDPVLSLSDERFLLKLTAFESLKVSEAPEEAGPNGYWLEEMGSLEFEVADEYWLVPLFDGRRPSGDAAKQILYADKFHTLPILFQRGTFLVAKQRPPWSYDLFNEQYVQKIWSDVSGRSICLSEASHKPWQRSLSDHAIETVLIETISDERQPTARQLEKGGRPRKIERVVNGYRELDLVEKKLSRELERRLLESHLGFKVSPTLLDRARKLLRDK